MREGALSKIRLMRLLDILFYVITAEQARKGLAYGRPRKGDLVRVTFSSPGATSHLKACTYTHTNCPRIHPTLMLAINQTCKAVAAGNTTWPGSIQNIVYDTQRDSYIVQFETKPNK